MTNCKKSYIRQSTNYNNRKGDVHKKMVENVLAKLRKTNLYKLDVGFNINEATVSSFIGRTAHIRFLENDALINMLIYRYEDLL